MADVAAYINYDPVSLIEENNSEETMFSYGTAQQEHEKSIKEEHMEWWEHGFVHLIDWPSSNNFIGVFSRFILLIYMSWDQVA